ncbi:hypothetical protein [Cribrihabitans neustonicus]|uniref:hypothetical protein n=1 Tax=Cribrihabitans neustonicus TaxID=1429085 RepID=UPI003B5C83D9
MPELVKLYIRNVAAGLAVAAVFATVLPGFDVINLRPLDAGFGGGVLAVVLLWGLRSVDFAGPRRAAPVRVRAEAHSRRDRQLPLRR